VLQRMALAAAVLLMMGCHSNPYSGIDDKLGQAPPVVTKPQQPGGCQIQGVIDVNEGATVKIPVTCVVPNGTPDITFQNKPAFATFLQATSELQISPQLGDAANPSNPTDTSRAYAAQVNLGLVNEPVTISSQNFTIVVHHVAQNATISNFDANAIIHEGDKYSSTFTVQSADFPNGPFTISGVNLPPGVTVQAVNSTTFEIQYNPGYKTVTTSNTTGFCRVADLCSEYAWNLNVIDPRGDMTSTKADWQVVDVRRDPIVIYPNPMSATVPSADFEIQVEDPNGEVEPLVTLVNTTTGSATLTVASSGIGNDMLPFSLMRALWTGVPTKSKKTVQTLKVHSCVYSDYNEDQTQCVDTSIDVQF